MGCPGPPASSPPALVWETGEGRALEQEAPGLSLAARLPGCVTVGRDSNLSELPSPHVCTGVRPAGPRSLVQSPRGDVDQAARHIVGRRPGAPPPVSGPLPALAAGDHSGRLGGDHVLRDGRSLLLQLHLLYPAYHSKCQGAGALWARSGTHAPGMGLGGPQGAAQSQES